MNDRIAVRLPRLLDKDLREVCRLHARMQSIELNIAPLSTASLMLEDGSGVAIRSFVELYNAKGSVGVFRVNMPDESFGSGERITLEHGICTLDDAIIPGQGEITGTPADVLRQILTHQTTKARGQNIWILGTVEAPSSMTITVEHDGTKTLEMLARAMTELQGYMLTFDQGAFPWVLNVVKKPETVACEGRLSRNIRTIRKTMDDSDLCTRLYCSLLDGGYIESDTIGVWGEVEQSITLNDDMPKDDAHAYCQRYLDNRKNPILAVQMDATEWYTLTGEKLDRFEIGDICRIALPEYGVTLEERIVALSYTNALGAPELATVSLANQIEDMSIKTAKTEQDVSDLKGTSKNYGNQLRTTNTEIQHLKEENKGFKEVDNKMVAWFAAAQIDLDATEEGANVGILATYQETFDLFSEVDTRVSQAELILHGGPGEAEAGLIAKVEENSNGIVSQNAALLDLKADTESATATLSARVDGVVGDVETQSEALLTLKSDTENATATLSARVGENEAAITATANELGSKVSISALEIELQGYVTASQLETKFSEFGSGIADNLYVSALSCNGFSCSSFAINGYGMSLKTHKRMTGGTIKSSYSPSYTVYGTDGAVIGKVNVPGDYSFSPKYATEEVYYMSWE